MGLYGPEVFANDARRCEIEIGSVDVNRSGVECGIEDDLTNAVALRRALGLPLRQGLGDAARKRPEEEHTQGEAHTASSRTAGDRTASVERPL
jgi:hypothetical protein